MLKKLKDRVSSFWKDESGSETIEFLFSSASLFGMIVVAFVIFSYAVELNLVNTTVKSITRNVEVTGRYNPTTMNTNFKTYLGTNSSLVYGTEPIQIYDISNQLPGNKIQLKGTFKVTGKVTYRIPLVHPFGYNGFNVDLPIQATVTGMSEVYWR